MLVQGGGGGGRAADLEGRVALHEAGEGGIDGGGEGVQHVLAVHRRQVQQHLHSSCMEHTAQAPHPGGHQGR